MSKQPKTDPAIREIKKAYRKTAKSELEKLRQAETFWKRRQTIANNKLKEVREALAVFTDAAFERLNGIDPEWHNSDPGLKFKIHTQEVE
jgi:hypothetical protein